MPANTYHFVEEWNFPAHSPATVYAILADAKLLPLWWRGIYLEAEPLGNYAEPTVGGRVRVKARGFLPYKLNFILEAIRLEKPRLLEIKATGDFNGVWRATLEPRGDGTLVTLDWKVIVEMPLIRILSPVLRPLFAWNHSWTTPRGEQGMRAYLAEKSAAKQAALPH